MPHLFNLPDWRWTSFTSYLLLICALIYSFFRQQALETERLRAAKIAALPPPVDPIGVRIILILKYYLD